MGMVRALALREAHICSRVPVLEDPSTGVTSWESGAVINYILRVYDREHKYGPGQSEQDKVEFDKWTFFNVSTLGPMQGQANWYIHYNPTENADARKRYVDWTYRCWKVLEDQLAKTGGQSLLETGYSAVDMHCYPWLHNHEYAGLPTDGYPNIQKYLKVMESKPELKAAYEKIPNGQKV